MFYDNLNFKKTTNRFNIFQHEKHGLCVRIFRQMEGKNNTDSIKLRTSSDST